MEKSFISSSSLHHHTEHYAFTKRLHTNCQAILFSETVSDPSQEEELIENLVKIDVVKSAHIPPSIVGMGLLLASIAAPIAHVAAKSLIQTQSRHPRFFSPIDDDDTYEEATIMAAIHHGSAVERRSITSQRQLLSKISARIPTSSPSLEELSKGLAFSFKAFIQKTQFDDNTNQLGR
jgi:hypothetical protein